MARNYAGLVRGRMSAAEKAEIERLATTLRKPTPGAIAFRLNRHPATVAWYMISRGLIDRRISYDRRQAMLRRGRPVNLYSRQQDRRLEQLRAEGLKFRQIAERLTEEFGIPRNQHSVRIRAIMLASYDDE